MSRRLTLEERLMSKVIKTETCWLFTGTLNQAGYGTVIQDGHHLKAHRASWMLHKGTIDDGLWVLHSCDNPACVNPDHLFLGTPQDNTTDMVSKGRRSPTFGESNTSAVLNKEKVVEIKEFLACNTPHRQIAALFGVSKSTITDINLGRTWND